MADASLGEARSGVFHGWWIVAVSFFAQFLALGCSVATYGLFIPVLTDEFGASFMTANLGLSILGVMMALAGAVVGPILDRRSIRTIMMIGALLNAVAFVLMSYADELWQLGVLFGLGIAVGGAMFGPLAANTVVAKWFERHRGRAVGIASMGAPAGGLLLAPLVGSFIGTYGWRETLLMFAALHVFLVPLLWVTIRNRPEDMNLNVDGARGPVLTQAASGKVWAAAQVLRSANFWVLALSFGAVGAIAGAFNANVIPYARDLDIGLAEASLFISAIGGTAILGTVLFGTLADRMSIRSLLWCSFAMQMVAFVLLRSVAPGYAMLMTGVLIFGLAAGAMMPLMAAAIGRGFGAVSFGRVMGFIGPVTLPFAFVGPPLTGWIRQTTDSYLLAFDGFVVVLLVACLILIGLKLPPPEETA
ncbi:MAG: MFS transporter [Gammaproteobacteria bacterium]|nr:MFS transporter [Gammaproteobacteria bacterium]